MQMELLKKKTQPEMLKKDLSKKSCRFVFSNNRKNA